jgi:hypothetical protein
LEIEPGEAMLTCVSTQAKTTVLNCAGKFLHNELTHPQKTTILVLESELNGVLVLSLAEVGREEGLKITQSQIDI